MQLLRLGQEGLSDIPAFIIAENGGLMAELENHMVCGVGFFDEEAARRCLAREEYEMEHADDAWDDWLGGEPIEHEAEADVSASVPDLR